MEADPLQLVATVFTGKRTYVLRTGLLTVYLSTSGRISLHEDSKVKAPVSP